MTKTIFMAIFLTLGCTGGGAAGCGSDSQETASRTVSPIDSSLLGIYAVDGYQGSELNATGSDVCEQLAPLEPTPSFIVLFSFLPDADADEARMGGSFCSNVEACQTVAEEALEPTLGYSFLQGSDESGWTGFAISRTGAVGQQCAADVQIHTLTAGGTTININTDTVETTFAPTLQGTQATCRFGDALAVLTPELPCKARLVLDATREADL